MFFSKIMSRRRFMQWLAAISALVPGVDTRGVRAAPTSQTTLAPPGYGHGAYGQNVYVGTPPPARKTFLPMINRGGQ